MAYSPLGGSGLPCDPIFARIGAAHGNSASAVALAWTIRSGKVIAIPESGSVAHVRENAVVLSLTLTQEKLHAAAQSPILQTTAELPVGPTKQMGELSNFQKHM
jgi:diketogulonate reductase-like aldo/keto reductase